MWLTSLFLTVASHFIYIAHLKSERERPCLLQMLLSLDSKMHQACRRQGRSRSLSQISYTILKVRFFWDILYIAYIGYIMTMTPTTRVVCSQVRPLVLSLAVGTHGRSTAEKFLF